LSEPAKSIEPTGGRVALSEALFRIGALRLGRFTLQEGKTSSYSLDLRVVPSDPEAYALAVTAYFEVLKEMGENSFDAVAGAGTPGVAFSSPVAYLLRKPMVHVKRDDADWKPVLLEGAVKPGWRTVVIGDVADRAWSLASAAEALRRAGCVVREAVVLVDRLEGERAKLKATGVKLNAFTDVRDLVQTLYDQKKVTKAGWQSVQKQTEEKDQ
jgi:orotate phosphoribosyltransferase